MQMQAVTTDIQQLSRKWIALRRGGHDRFVAHATSRKNDKSAPRARAKYVQPIGLNGSCVVELAAVGLWLGEEVTVSLDPLLSRAVQPSQTRLASLRRSIKNASMADLAQSEVKTDVWPSPVRVSSALPSICAARPWAQV
jgi:hypothetical protein